MIDSLPLGPDQETMLGISALHTVASIIEVMSEILASVPSAQEGLAQVPGGSG